MVLDWAPDLARMVHREVEAIERHEGTLSEAIARAFRTRTKIGKVVFLVVLASGSSWLGWHITTFQYE